jgi:hypothetical protein
MPAEANQKGQLILPLHSVRTLFVSWEGKDQVQGRPRVPKRAQSRSFCEIQRLFLKVWDWGQVCGDRESQPQPQGLHFWLRLRDGARTHLRQRVATGQCGPGNRLWAIQGRPSIPGVGEREKELSLSKSRRAISDILVSMQHRGQWVGKSVAL